MVVGAMTLHTVNDMLAFQIAIINRNDESQFGYIEVGQTTLLNDIKAKIAEMFSLPVSRIALLSEENNNPELTGTTVQTAGITDSSTVLFKILPVTPPATPQSTNQKITEPKSDKEQEEKGKDEKTKYIKKPTSGE